MDKNNAFDRLHMMVELSGSKCELNHGPGCDIPDAVDFLVQEFSSPAGNYKVAIPICQDCIDGLASDEWVLLYCITCNSSQWIFKPLARRRYPDGTHLLWMDRCPKCNVQ